MITRALSVGWFVDRLMRGPLRTDVGLGHGHLKVGSYVMSITEPGSPRMPNGIECPLTLIEGDSVMIGGGVLGTARTRVLPGPVWVSKPTLNVALEASTRLDPDVAALLGAGPGLTPAGDDVLVGYTSGRVLFHGDATTARNVHSRAVGHTTLLSVTLLFHATLGELPEPAHDLLEAGDVQPLLSFGHSSGRPILLGLALACSKKRKPMASPLWVIPIEGVGDVPRTTVRVFPAAPSVELPPRTSSAVSSSARGSA